jgi:hypothetical protein
LHTVGPTDSKPTTNGAPTAPRPVSATAPTPRPQAVGSLPTRNSLRGAAPAAPPKPAPPPEKVQPQPEETSHVPVPGGGGVEEPTSWWDGSMGPLGVMMTAAVACGLGYLAFKLFN